MKICFITETYHPKLGGQYTAIKELSSQCKKNKINYCILHNKSDFFVNKSLFKNILSSSDIFYFIGGWSLFYIKLHYRVLNLKKKIIIHPLGLYEPWALRQKRIKKFFAWKFYQEKTLLTADLVHCASDKERNGILHLNKRIKTIVLPLGINKNFIKKKNKFPLKKRALFFSRLLDSKGLTNLIEAWICIENNDWILDIIGNGPSKHFINMASKTKKNIKINFLKPIYSQFNKLHMFDKYDLLILPTKNESFSFAILESLARGLPVLTTNQTPWHFIQKKNAGWIINDSLIELKLVLNSIFNLSEKNFSIKKKNSIDIAYQYTWSKIFPLYINMFKKLIKS